MKFSVTSKHVSHMGRLGVISDLTRLPQVQFETPMFMLYAKSGIITHITHEVLKMISNQPFYLQIPFNSISLMKESIQESKQNLSSFIGMQEYPSFIPTYDPLNIAPQKLKKKTLVTLSGRRGNEDYSAEKFISFMEGMQPDMYLLMSCIDFLGKVKHRDRNRQFISKCLELHKQSKVLKGSTVLVPVQGGLDPAIREDSAKSIATLEDVDGYLIDGLYESKSETENVPPSFLKNCLENSLKMLPNEKLRILPGPWSPETVVSMVYLGVDIFDSTLPLELADRGCAFTFQYSNSVMNGLQNGMNLMNGDDLVEEDTSELIETKNQPETTKDEDSSCQISPSSYKPKKYEMSLHDVKYVTDFTPILPNCSCLTCSHHTRGYIHHLLNTQEMLAQVLLSIHNIHHYLEFFKTIRQSISSEKPNEYSFHYVKL